MMILICILFFNLLWNTWLAFMSLPKQIHSPQHTITCPSTVEAYLENPIPSCLPPRADHTASLNSESGASPAICYFTTEEPQWFFTPYKDTHIRKKLQCL